MSKGLFTWLLLLVIFSSKAIGQAPVIFKGDDMVIGDHVSVLEDPANRLNINQVKASLQFIPSKVQVPNFQLSKSDFWLRFSIKNESADSHLLLSLEYPSLDVCDFYYPVNGSYQVEHYSDNLPFNHRKYKHQNFLFDINVPQDSMTTYYLKVRSGEQMVLPLILGTPQKIAEHFLTQQILWGILIGLLLVMIFYNLFVFISTRDRSYLYYVLYTSFIGLTQTSLSGYTYRYLFYNAPLLYNKGLIVFPGLAGISAVFFITSFLHTRERTPRLHKLFPVIIVLYALAIVLRILGFDHISYRMIDISALCITVITYAVAIPISLQGYRPAKLFLAGWTIFFAGVILFVLRNLGILPYNDFTNYTMQVGTAFEVTILSLALADRINILKQEKEASQAESLMVAKENERIIREQNVILEQKVSERTHELNETNHELNTTLEDLKQTQSQLVESEKMASLGQLTAGIAHEINNPINFVSSNVNPLKRDVEMLFNAFNVVEEVSMSDLPAAEKQKKIKDFKEELDFDYLTTEISHLIKGINEGANRTAEIVKGLKLFSRLDEDDLKKADINEGLESTMVIANNLLNNKIKIIKQYADLPLVECYPGKLNQVFLNIISNAAYAVQKRFGETPDGEIVLSTSFDDEYIYIKIKDNGVGIDPQTQNKIFDPFFTTKDVGEGTGLGLSISYNTIKKHNGHITFNSTPGEGTEFIIQIPIIFDIKAT